MLKYLIEKEFKQFFRNTFLPKVVVILPFFAILLFPTVANFDVENLNLSIVDSDKSPYSSQLVRKIESSGYYRITNVSSTYSDALKSVEQNQSDVILEIPQQFETDLVGEGKRAHIVEHGKRHEGCLCCCLLECNCHRV